MDKRRKPMDREAERALRDQLDAGIHANMLGLADAVKAMRRISRLTQAEFAKHRNISLHTLKQIEAGTGNPTVDTLNKIGEIFGMEIAFIHKR
jgi:DNA-binding XRE family transcriptional regulator